MADQHPHYPPTQAGGAVQFAQQPSWHIPIGIICIILGGLGVLGGCFGVIGAPLMSAFEEELASSGIAHEFGYAEEMTPLTMAMSVVALLVALMLLFVGIGIVQRRKSVVSSARAWAVIKMVLVVANVLVQYTLMGDQMDAMVADANALISGSTFRIIFIAGSVVGVAWGWALPIFLLVWFSRDKIRAQVADWPDRNAAQRLDR